MRITEEVESARDGRVCAWRSGPRAQVSGEPRGDIPEACGVCDWGRSGGNACVFAFEGVDEAVVVAAHCGGAAAPAGGTFAYPWYVYHAHQRPS